MKRKEKGRDAAAKRPGCEPRRDPREQTHSITNSKSCQAQQRPERRRKRTETEEQGLPGYWAVLPAQIRYDPELPPMARLLYAEISALTDRTGYCYAANAYFQRLFRITERTLQGHLRTLKERGYIRIEDGDGGAGRRRIYAGINPLQQNPAKNCGVTDNPAKNCGVTPQKTAGSTIEEQDNITIPPKAPQGAGRASGGDSSGLTAGGTGEAPSRGQRVRKKVKSAPEWKPDRFQGFWDYYPKSAHKSKQAAIRSWDRLRPSDELIAEIGKALKRQKETDLWQREIGIPYPATYLNQRRWEDEIPDTDLDDSGPERRLAGERC